MSAISRREFIAGGTAAIGGLATVGAPVKSMLGARNAFTVGGAKGWTNPYVTDGLVAMWDGEWNAGGGVHTTDRILTNLVTGDVVSIPMSGYTVGDNYIISDANRSFTLGNLLGKISVPCTLACVGCCLSRPSNIANTSGMFTVDGLCGLFMWRKDSIGASGVTGGSLCQSDGRIHYYGGPADKQLAMQDADNEVFGTLRSRAAVIQQLHSEGVAYYYEGKEKDGTNTMNYTDAWSSATYDVVTPSSSSCKIKWCNISLYSRALTAAEIAANYAVDKERFGLP